MSTDVIFNPNVTRKILNETIVMGANGRKFPMNSISGTTSSAQTTLATSDSVGTIAQGSLVMIQPATGTGGCWYALGSNPTADATCVFLPENVQEYVFLFVGDTKIAVKNASASGIVNVFNIR